MTEKSYTRMVEAGRGSLVYLVRGKNNGASAWYYLMVNQTKLPLFKRHLNSPSLTLTNYGRVLYSGWGEDPPEEIRDKIAKEYS